MCGEWDTYCTTNFMAMISKSGCRPEHWKYGLDGEKGDGLDTEGKAEYYVVF